MLNDVCGSHLLKSPSLYSSNSLKLAKTEWKDSVETSWHQQHLRKYLKLLEDLRGKELPKVCSSFHDLKSIHDSCEIGD